MPSFRGRHLPGGGADENKVPDVLRSKTLDGTPLYLVHIYIYIGIYIYIYITIGIYAYMYI